MADIGDTADCWVGEEVLDEGCGLCQSVALGCLSRFNSLSAIHPVAMMPHFRVKGEELAMTLVCGI